MSNKRLIVFFVPLMVISVGAWAGEAAKEKPNSTVPPEGFVEMTVAGVMDTEGGRAVVLTEGKKDGRLLPIWIGDTEAFAIQLRLERRRFQRPLTHDLLDTIMTQLGGQLVKIHVDDLKSNTFVGTVFIRHNDKTISFDSRPSDAIALALGSRAPIFVAVEVLKRAGVPIEEHKPSPPAEASDPEKLLKDILDSKREEHTL